MQKLQLDVLFQIFGIGAASGLVYNNDALFIIADNSTFLYEYKIHEKELYNIKLSQNSQQNIVKKEKPDFESISIKDNKLYMFGSGSTNQRMKCFTYDLKSKKIVKKDISALYYKLKKIAAIGDEDFNIEGAYFYNKNWYLLQRGNGANAKNGIFIVARQNNKTKFVPVLLPKINQVAT